MSAMPPGYFSSLDSRTPTAIRELLLALPKDTFMNWMYKRYFCNICAVEISVRGSVSVGWNSIGMPLHSVAELDVLTFSERRLIGRVSVAAELHLRRSGEQHGLVGCVVMAPRDEPIFIDLLKNPDELFSHVLLTPVRDGVARDPIPFPVNSARIQAALLWLKKNNALYADLDVAMFSKVLRKHTKEIACDDSVDASGDALSDEDVGADRPYVLPVDSESRATLHLKDMVGKKISSTNPTHLRAVDAKAFPSLFPYGTPGIFQCAKNSTRLPVNPSEPASKRSKCTPQKASTRKVTSPKSVPGSQTVDSCRKSVPGSQKPPNIPVPDSLPSSRTTDSYEYKTACEYLNSRIHSCMPCAI